MYQDNHRRENTSLISSDESNKEDDSSRNVELEELLKSSGFGLFHVILVIVSGLALTADCVEVMAVSFVVPVADDLNMSTAEKGYLNASIFVGMLIGGYIWGSLADVYGRKKTLISAMLLNGISSTISALSPNYPFFLVARLISGIGVGGSLPIVTSYVSEFVTEKQRGPFLVVVSSFWLPGNVYTALLAWGLLGTSGPRHDISFYIGSLHFVNWRLYLIICTIPAFTSFFILLFMTETPAFLFQIGKRDALNNVMKQIYKVNHTCYSSCLFIKPTAQPIPLSVIEAEGEDVPASNSVSVDGEPVPVVASRIGEVIGYILARLKKVAVTTVDIFRRKHIRATSVLLVITFGLFFGYYGLQLWFPEYFKRVRLANNPCANQTLIPVSIINCTNSSRLQFYEDTVYISIAGILGYIAGSFLVVVTGAKIIMFLALSLSSFSVFAIWFIPDSDHAAVLAMSCLFAAVTGPAFGYQCGIIANLYDTRLRSTSLGLLFGQGRIAAILSTIMFGYFLDVNKAIPIVTVASVLLLAALATLFLPPIYRQENLPPLPRLLSRFRTWIWSKFMKFRQ